MRPRFPLAKPPGVPARSIPGSGGAQGVPPSLRAARPNGLRHLMLTFVQRRRVKAAFAADAERLRLMLEACPVPLVLARGGLVEFANAQMGRLLRVPEASTLHGCHLGALVAPESRAQVLRNAERRVKGEPAPDRYEIVGLRHDGTPFPCEISSTVINLADGPVVLAYVNDISERREAEDALRSSHQRLIDTIE